MKHSDFSNLSESGIEAESRFYKDKTNLTATKCGKNIIHS